ncbi:stage V sporulation protein S [Desulfovirgula thermocuniculi]|uniref:stage V sporulation protein S n=1 Tax=Desulfovirgula thermocuniculi TaxID=348842 RepID=UPI00042836B2|nr:stage V sporulation protein S [Desulfovirgula thermocuniculi]
MPRVKLKGQEPVRFRPYFMDPPPRSGPPRLLAAAPAAPGTRPGDGPGGGAPARGAGCGGDFLEAVRGSLVFRAPVASDSDPAKVAGSVAKALASGCGRVEVLATGEAALARLLLALGIAQRFVRENGGEARFEFERVDLSRPSVTVLVSQERRPGQVTQGAQ